MIDSDMTKKAAMELESADNSKLGSQLRDARKKKGWTLEETGKAANVSRSTLSKIENNQTKPSFNVVRQLTRILEMEPPQLFVQANQSSAAGRRVYTLDGKGEIKDTPTYHHELLCSELTSKRMLPYITTVKARDFSEFATWIRHRGEEFLYVISGELILFTEHYQPLKLKTGDSVYYDSSMGHGCVSTSKEDAKILWVSLEE